MVRENQKAGWRATSQPSKRPPTDQPGGGAEALGMSVVSEPPRGWDASPRKLVFRELHQTSCIILTLSSHYPPLIGNHRHANTRCPRFIAATATIAADPEAVVRTWVPPRARLLSVAIEQSRGRDRNKEKRRYIETGDRVSHLGVAICRLPLLSCRSLHFNLSESREIMAPDSCDRVPPVTSRRSSGEENRLRGTFGIADS